MPSPRPVMYPGGPTRRAKPAGLGAGAPLSTISGPSQAFALVAEDMIACEHALRELLHSDVQAVEAVSTYLAAAGGKRLRPALTALGAKADELVRRYGDFRYGGAPLADEDHRWLTEQLDACRRLSSSEDPQ